MRNGVELLLSGQQFRQLYEKRYADIMTRYCLRKVEIDVLYILSLGDVEDTAKQLAKNNYISKAHISKAVENLVAKNLIFLVTDKQDHRKYHLKLTEESKEVVEEIAGIHKELLKLVFENVTKEEMECLDKVSRKVMSNIDALIK